MKKDQNYSVRFSEAMLQFLIHYAKEKDMLPSEYLRDIVRREMDREMGKYKNGQINKQNTEQLYNNK